MSELKVNKISPETGTAITLGDSGDTFTVPSGCNIVNSGTATGFGGGKILQVVEGTIKTDTETSTVTSFTTIPGMSVAITPSATSSKIIVSCTWTSCQQVGTNNPYFRLVRDSTAIFSGAAAGSRTQMSVQNNSYNANVSPSSSITMVDAPSSTSALTYALQWIQAGGTMYFNRSNVDTDSAGYGRAASQITVMEIGA